MTRKRDIESDKFQTFRLLQLLSRGINDDSYGSPNWLGHTHGSAKLDKALLNGATMNELLAIRGAINQHFDHLRIEHGLDIDKDGDIYRINVTKS